MKLIPKDDYSNINIIRNKKIISADLAAKLREANGLRNRNVHDYNGLDNEIAYNRLLNLLEYFQEFKVKSKNFEVNNLHNFNINMVNLLKQKILKSNKFKTNSISHI